MARRRTHVPIAVFLNGRPVGQLRRQANGAVEFQYDQSWLTWEHALPVSLSLPLREDRYTGDRVTVVFDNLLPDSAAIRRRMAERMGADGDDVYSLLAKVGRDCVGALQFLPEDASPGPAGGVEGRKIDYDEIASRLEALASAPLGMDGSEEFRISLAGAQEKTALLLWNDHWHVPHGTTPTTHILKPQIGRLPGGIDFPQSVENEYFCLKLAAALGLPAANAEIRAFGGRNVLVVERFDRVWARDGRLLRVPQEDCCQALSVPPTRKYEAEGGPGMAAILDLLKGSDQPEEDRRAFLKAHILFWLMAATDGHAKNFSLFLRPGGRFRLAPLYDVMSTQPALDSGQLQRNKMKLALAVGTRRHYAVHEIAPRHFIESAAQSGLSATVVREIFHDIRAVAEDAISRVTAALPTDFPEEIAVSVLAGLRARLQLTEQVEA